MSYTEHYVSKDDQPYACFLMYNMEGLIKDKKIVETKSYKDYILKMMKETDTETIEELGEFYDENFGEGEWEQHKKNKMITCMMEEKILILNPRLEKENKVYYLESEVLYY